MRISDWSSDVCSSDLPNSTVLALHYWKQREPLAGERITWRTDPFRHAASYIAMRTNGVDLRSSMMAESVYGYFPVVYRSRLDPYAVMGDVESNPPEVDLLRSEEHTSELQSLMRISYAVFCLKKKNTTTQLLLENKIKKLHTLTNSQSAP